MTKTGFKKVVMSVAAIAALVVVGCKTIPTIDQLYRTSYTVGLAAGSVANLTKLDDKARTEIISIAKKVDLSMPQTNQTFKAAWTEIAIAHTEELIKAGTIDETQAEMILSGFNLVVTGIDYYIDKRHPEVRQYQDMTAAVGHGGIAGFLTTFKPANLTSAGTSTAVINTVDQELYNEAFDYLRTQTPMSR